MEEKIIQQAQDLLEACRKAKMRLATAESCTGGLIAAYLTEEPGSSTALDRGYVTYSNEAKHQELGVPPSVIAVHGAVSREVAELMAKGALRNSDADLAVAVTGIAGPDGGSEAKPVGTVHIAVAGRQGVLSHEACAFGDIGRREVRRESVLKALKMMRDAVDASVG